MQRTIYNYFPGTVRPLVSFLQGPKQEQKNIEGQISLKTEKTVVEEKRKNGIPNQEGATSQPLDQKVYWSSRETINQ